MDSTEFTYTIPHLENIDTTAKAFGLSSYTVRKLARSKRGASFTVRIGNRYLINWERFLDFLNCEPLEQGTAEPAEQTAKGIQPVPVKL